MSLTVEHHNKIDLADVLGRLAKVKKNGGGYMALCPCHEDRNPSLSITERDGKILAYCHACEAGLPEIVKAVGLDNGATYAGPGITGPLVREVGAKVTKLKPKTGRIVSEYNYRDEGGELVYQVVRFEPKDFRQRRPDGKGGWTWNLEGVRRVLYNLPAISIANPEKLVVIVEGEKDADALSALGVLATTNPGGAGKWDKVDSSPLKGRRVVILPDNDEPGRNHARQVGNALSGIAASVKVVELPGIPEKGDVSDFLNVAGNVVPDFEALAKDAPEYVPTSEDIFGEAAETDWTELRNDYGNAALTKQKAGDRLLFEPALETWYVWTGHRWKEDKNEARGLAVGVLKDRYETLKTTGGDNPKDERVKFAEKSLNTRRIVDALEMCQTFPELVLQSGQELDANPFLLGCNNGVVDLRTGELRDGRREDRITKSVGLEYNPGAKCPRWLLFLNEIFAGDVELMRYAHRAAGYSLTGETREQCYFIAYGKGANGKSTFLEILRYVLGEYGANAAFSTFASPKDDNPGGTAADIAALRHARLVTASEIRENTRFNEGRIKSLTGGDALTARIPFARQPITFSPAFKVWLAVNHLPNVSDTTPAFWRRVRCIPFKATFDPTKEPNLRDTLRAEAQGILAWAVQGAILWAREGLGKCEAIRVATDDYRQEIDLVGQFLKARCEVPETVVTNGDILFRDGEESYVPVFCSEWTPAKELYSAFKNWCDVDDPKAVMSEKSFANRLREKGIEKQRMKRGVVYVVRLKDESPDE